MCESQDQNTDKIDVVLAITCSSEDNPVNAMVLVGEVVDKVLHRVSHRTKSEATQIPS